MPIKRNSGEDKDDFISRCMSVESGKFPDEKQRYAVCAAYWTDAEVSDNMPNMSIKFTDAAKIGEVRRTKEGYVSAFARAVRVGVQDYGAWESDHWLSLAEAVGKSSKDVVRVYRPPESVFSKDSLKSAIHIPVTLNHPPEMVDSANWSDYAIGETGSDVMRDGELVAFSLMLKDEKGTKAFDSGVVELSAGYTAELHIADKGLGYDYIMGPPEYNHLALVPKGRAGSQARIGDAATWGASPITVEDNEMTVELKTVIFGDASVEVKASDAATVAAILKDHKSAIDAKDAEIAVLTTQLADAASKVLTDEQIAEKAKAMADAAAKRESVKAKVGDVADGWTDAQVDAAWEAVGKPNDSVRDAIKDAKPKKSGENPWDEFYAKKEKGKK